MCPLSDLGPSLEDYSVLYIHTLLQISAFWHYLTNYPQADKSFFTFTYLHNFFSFLTAGDGTIRLVGGLDRCQGRVEIYYRGSWGTVCDDDWGIRDAAVVCQQVGCGPVITFTTNAYFGYGKGLILLDNVHCSGSESELAACYSLGWGIHNCGHHEDAGVICTSRFKYAAVITESDYKLIPKELCIGCNNETQKPVFCTILSVSLLFSLPLSSAGLTTTTAPPVNTETKDNAIFHTEVPAGKNDIYLCIIFTCQHIQLGHKVWDHTESPVLSVIIRSNMNGQVLHPVRANSLRFYWIKLYNPSARVCTYKCTGSQMRTQCVCHHTPVGVSRKALLQYLYYLTSGQYFAEQT